MAETDETKKLVIQTSAEVTVEKADSERMKAVDELVKACVEAKKDPDVILKAIGLGGSSDGEDSAARFFLKQEDFLKAIELVALKCCSEDFLAELAEFACDDNWINESNKSGALIESDNEFLLNSMKNIYIRKGDLLHFKKLAALRGRATTEAEITEIVWVYCNNGNLVDAINVVEELERGDLRIVEIRTLTEVIKSQTEAEIEE